MSNDLSLVVTHEAPVVEERARARWPALVAAGVGALLLYVVGFAGPHAIHEAAHDARHSLNFPCH